MCDYSLEDVKSRAANVGDKLTAHRFPRYTTGFAASEDIECAVCIQPGTELAFDADIKVKSWYGSSDEAKVYPVRVAKFIQLNKDVQFRHHDAIELVSGEQILLNDLVVDQTCSVLQLPAQPVVEHVDLPAASEVSEPGPVVAEVAPDFVF